MRFLPVFLSFFLSAPLQAHQQAASNPPALAARATISGTVSDSAGGRLPRATVRIRDASGAVVSETLTDAQGAFRFGADAEKSFTIEVELTGFETRRVEARPGGQLEIALAVAPVRERVVVTATRTEAPTSQVGSSVTVLHRETLDSLGAWNVSALLRLVPGLTPTQSGPPGAVSTLFARGGESDHNRVFIDGVPVNEPGGLFNFANLTTAHFERVEVVRGPQSALFGSDAMGSTVQLFTRRGAAETPRPQLDLALDGGNHHTVHADTNLSGKLGWFDYEAGVDRYLTDNQGLNAAFRNTAASGNFGAALGERTSLRAILHGNFGRAGTPGQTAFQRPDSDAHIRRGDGVVSFAFATRLHENWNQRLGYGYSQTRYHSLNLFDDPPPFSDFLFDSLNDTRRHRATWQSDLTLRRTQIFTLAFEYEREKGRLVTLFPQFPAFSPPPVIVHRTNIGGVAQHQALLWNRLFVTAGVRAEGNGSFGTAATPRVSLAYVVRRASGDTFFGPTKLKFNFGTGIKEPSFLENFSQSFGFMGNPDLKPERVRSFDFGIEQRAWRDRAKLEINWFDNRFRDLVAFVGGTFVNLGKAKAKGAEIVLEVAPGRGLRGIGSYTFLDGQVEDSPNPASPVIGVGRPLLRRPRHTGSLVALWDWRWFAISSTAVIVGRRVDSDFFFPPLGLTSNDGYAKWDLRGSFRSSHKVTYFVALENLLDERYQEALGYPALGRGVHAGARLAF